MNAPKAEQIPFSHNEHGYERFDPYHWMRDRENPELIHYLEEENRYTEEKLAHLKSFRGALFHEMKSRIKETDMSVPYEYEGFFYYTRYIEGGEYPIYCRKEGSLDAREEVMLDVNQLAENKSYYSVRSLSVSRNKRFLVFGEDCLGRRIYTLRVKDLKTGEFLEDVIENTSGAAVWDDAAQYLFYTIKDESLRSFKVLRHKIGSPQSEDELVFHEKDETFSCSVFKSKSLRFIFIASYATESAEYRFVEAKKPLSAFKTILKREDEHEYSVDHFEEHFYILTNWKAKNFRLMRSDISNTRKEKWTEIIGHREDVLLEDIELFNDYMVVEERQHAMLNLKVIHPASGSEHIIEFPEEVYSVWTGTNYEFASTKFRLGYTSMTTPTSVFEYDMETRNMVLLKQQEVLGDFNKDDFETKRLWITVRDGVKVPTSMVYKKNLIKREAPLLLYAYGSYGHSIDPYFSSIRLSLLNRGFVFVIAHIRGGEEMGRDWYDNGKKLKKMNTFNDFIDVAEYLIQEKWTSNDHLYAMGGSAGGLLMGAVVNMKPELWKGVVASVPFVDVLSTMFDETIPLTTGEYDEWGNPNDKEYFDYILQYSPYDNVSAKNYPNMLVTSGLHDSQVQYWEPTKWVAKIRSLKTDNNLLLLHTNMEAGHSGASGRFESLHEVALEYAFLLNLEGIVK